jgi:hypothetical protein
MHERSKLISKKIILKMKFLEYSLKKEIFVFLAEIVKKLFNA